MREISGVPFRTCRPDEEEQATNFGGTLLLPGRCSSPPPGKASAPAADKYDVTIEMARFRYNSTGVKNQVPQAVTG